MLIPKLLLITKDVKWLPLSLLQRAMISSSYIPASFSRAQDIPTLTVMLLFWHFYCFSGSVIVQLSSYNRFVASISTVLCTFYRPCIYFVSHLNMLFLIMLNTQHKVKPIFRGERMSDVLNSVTFLIRFKSKHPDWNHIQEMWDLGIPWKAWFIAQPCHSVSFSSLSNRGVKIKS